MSTARDPHSETGEDDSFDALLKEAAHVSGPGVAAAGAGLRVGGVLLEGRLSVLRRIGEGGMGIVYEARDTQRGGSVALKTLSRLDAGNVYRLKNEFRSLADVSHPNLCHLHELFSEAGQWFFTMELIDGVRFDRWVRPEGVLDEPRLRSALGQLADAIDAIHRVGKLHRDLKPSNVLLTPDGRLVVLDFGLAIDPELGGVGQTVMDDSVSGTPAYMAPEQAAGLPATAASDVYALGVMLFEALTGKLPFTGRTHDMLVDKQRSDAPRASALSSDIPNDLDALCADLLARDPAQRPDVAALRSALSETTASGLETAIRLRGARRAVSTSDVPEAATELLGREAELQALRDAYAASLAGKPVVLFLSGESGMGKSALATVFLDELASASQRSHAVVLAGRCYERENVPFKGFDSIVDALSRYLRKLSGQEAAALLPREVFALARVFPVLDRVQVVAEAPVKDVPDPNDLKRRAFEAFGELLARMRDRAPLVLFIDDVQWFDHDSVRFMRALFVHGAPASMLLICAHRSERAVENPFLQSVAQAARDNPAIETRVLEIGPLDPSALQALAQRLLPPASGAFSAATFAHEAHGSPFFAAQLARAAAIKAPDAPLPSLRDAIGLHIGALPAGAQRLLSLIALAGQPLPAALVVAAAGTSDGHTDLDTLRSEQLVRVSIDAEGARSVECYHDKIREHVAGALDALSVKELGLGLARALLAAPASDPELLARCFELAGLPQDSALHAARAAEIAFAALAFDRAAQLFQQALEHGRFGEARAQELRVRFADALAAAGYGERAGAAYVVAARAETGDTAQELILKASGQYLICGELGQGRTLLAEALRPVGLSLPTSAAGSLASVVWSRSRTKLRGLSFTARERHDEATLRELDVLRVATTCLVRSDQLRAADFSARYLRCALDAGHIEHAARALAVDSYFSALAGAPPARVSAMLALCRELGPRSGNVVAAHQLTYYEALIFISREGAYDRALDLMNRMLELNSEQVLHEASYDRAWVQFHRATCFAMLGNITEARELAHAQLEETLARGDRTTSAGFAQLVCVGLIGSGSLEQAQRVCDRAVAHLSSDEVMVQDYTLLPVRCCLALARGSALQAWYELQPVIDRIRGSFFGRFLLRGSVDALACGMVAAASCEATQARERDELRKLAKRYAAGAKRTAYPNPIVPEAVLACLDGDRATAVAAMRRKLSAVRGPMLRQLMLRRLGTLLNDSEGAALVAEADAFLRSGGIIDPERFVAVLVPGLELQPVASP